MNAYIPRDFHILAGETLADALRRTLGREPTYEDGLAAIGFRFTGHSIVERDRSPSSQSQDDGLTEFKQT